mmetsp:Transcript_21667/g.62286  ORF Transcript_21667/g.62286 Transcript_21667/m.62286 type:complete len:276 (-) Transcript_21667:358-1185(-)
MAPRSWAPRHFAQRSCQGTRAQLAARLHHPPPRKQHQGRHRPASSWPCPRLKLGNGCRASAQQRKTIQQRRQQTWSCKTRTASNFPGRGRCCRSSGCCVADLAHAASGCRAEGLVCATECCGADSLRPPARNLQRLGQSPAEPRPGFLLLARARLSPACAHASLHPPLHPAARAKKRPERCQPLRATTAMRRPPLPQRQRSPPCPCQCRPRCPRMPCRRGNKWRSATALWVRLRNRHRPSLLHPSHQALHVRSAGPTSTACGPRGCLQKRLPPRP